MDEEVAVFLHVVDADHQVFTGEVAAIANLSARLSIERSLVEHHLHFLSGFNLSTVSPPTSRASTLLVLEGGLVAQKLRGVDVLRQGIGGCPAPSGRWFW